MPSIFRAEVETSRRLWVLIAVPSAARGESLKYFFLLLLALVFVFSAMSVLCQDANPPIYSEIIPISSGLPYDPGTDIQRDFFAPNGKRIEVLIKGGPVGSGTYSGLYGKGRRPTPISRL